MTYTFEALEKLQALRKEYRTAWLHTEPDTVEEEKACEAYVAINRVFDILGIEY